MEFANFLHVEVVAQVSNTVVQIFTWTPLEFLRRLNASERIATRTRAKTDPIVEDFMDLLDRASEVRSDDADVSNGLKYLWAVGILQTGRVGEIMGVVNG
jgi:hypothetical protein